MTGKVLTLTDVVDVSPDNLAMRIADQYVTWENMRQVKMDEWKEIQQYVFATDTSKTRNNKQDWSNRTTIPKLCQIRDNLYANYMAALFPKRKWLVWEGSYADDEVKDKRDAIESYMAWVLDRQEFYSEVSKIVLDYIDYGNPFVTVEWVDNTSEDVSGKRRLGYAGPMLKRISPTDIVFNPVAPNFQSSPKIIRSFVSLGEVKKMILDKVFQSEEEEKAAHKLFSELRDLRQSLSEFNGEVDLRDNIYQISGFDSYRQYLGSGNVEILTFYGDIYDEANDVYYENKIIKIIDRLKILSIETNPSFFGQAPIYHAGWRIRPDNLWAMGPLDNLVGMQYRIDHLENMKADVFDVIAYPPLKIKGHVQDFTWGPMERIYIGDDGDVTMLTPDTQALMADNQIAILEAKMEEMAGSPKEAMGFRTPGEKTAFEVQRLEQAAGRIFQSKVSAFERDVLEPVINAMLELARRYMTQSVIRTFDNQEKLTKFLTLTAEDITGSGRIKPIAARHFAEKANIVQTINSFFSSSAGQDPLVKVHFSGLELAKMWEHLLDMEDYNIVDPYIALAEQADAQRMQHSNQQQVALESQTAAGILPGDHDPTLGELESAQAPPATMDQRPQ